MPRLAFVLAVAAPLLVVLLLLVVRSVAAVFVFYHLVLCLLIPALVNLVGRRTGWRRHRASLGLTGSGLGLGVLLSVAAAGGTALALSVDGGVLLATADPVAALSRWGVAAGGVPTVLWFMAVLNAPAEELFWRGWLATELSAVSDRRLALVLPVLAWSSYHAVTLAALVRRPDAILVMMVGVVAAGLLWTWLRERTGSVWPALLSHTAATWSYVAAAWKLFDL